MLNYNAEQESVNNRPIVVKLHKIFVYVICPELHEFRINFFFFFFAD
jgi:hypothetical protein